MRKAIEELESIRITLNNSINILKSLSEKAEKEKLPETYKMGIDFAITLYETDIKSLNFQIDLLKSIDT